MSLPWNALLEQLNQGTKFLITSHVRPDCDALGSELGLAGVLEAMGKEVAIVNADPAPANIAFIDPQNKIQTLGIDATADSIPEHDVFVVVDTSAWVQLGAMADVMRQSTATKLVIDHHVSSDDLDAVEFKNIECEATGRLITELAEAAGVSLTESIAMPLLAALMTDTGWLRFPSVSASSYEIAAKLIAGGANPSWLYGQLYEQETLPENVIRGRIASRMKAEAGNRIVHTYALNEDFTETGAPRTATENCVNQGLRIAETLATFIMVEQEAGGFKVSFRSRGPTDCSKVAEHFGGGGHKAAAGAFINEGSLELSRQQILAVLTAAIDG